MHHGCCESQVSARGLLGGPLVQPMLCLYISCVSLFPMYLRRFPRLGAYVHFLFDFVTEQSQVPNSEEGYIMTTFEVHMSVCQSLSLHLSSYVCTCLCTLIPVLNAYL